jgi:hypothetical protein
LITTTNNFETISDPRKAACHAGVAPFKNESGTSRNLRPKVSKMADQGLENIVFSSRVGRSTLSSNKALLRKKSIRG